MSNNNHNFKQILQDVKVMPVLVIEHLEDTIPIAKALMAGGINVIEITLRTKIALKAIKKISQEMPDITVGAGSVNSAKLFEDAKNAGAKFMVSPGFTKELLNTADRLDTPYLPGVATVSEAMQLQDLGYKYLKLFPAEALNGVALLKSIYGPLPDLRFCPTGGIEKQTMQKYLDIPNVVCVGGSWLAPKKLIDSKNFVQITKLTKKISRN